MNETVRLDGVDVVLTPDTIIALFNEKKRQYEELRGRFDAMGLELEREKAARAALEDPQSIEAKVQARLKLVERCRKLLGEDTSFDGKSDDEIKLLSIKKPNPELDLTDKEQSYIDGMFEALSHDVKRNDSFRTTRQTIAENSAVPHHAYLSWLEQSAKLWSLPLTGSLR